MSKYCAIPGCQSQIEKTTLFSVTCTAVLSEWWTMYNGNAEWCSKRGGKLTSPDICIAHFQEDQLEQNHGMPRLKEDAVPSVNIPFEPSITIKKEDELIIPSDHQECDEEIGGDGDILLMFCRFCGVKQKYPIENHLEDLVKSEELLQLCLGRGRFLEGFPTGVCNHCLEIIRATTNFINDCGKAQEKLQNIFFGTTHQMEESLEVKVEQDLDHENSFVMPEAIVSLSESNDPCVFRDQNALENTDDEEDAETPNTSNDRNGNTPGDDSDIRCEICDRTFKRRVALKAHIESIHEKRTFTCPVCGKSMGWRKTLQRHMKSHEKNFHKYNCELCGKTFSRLSHLRLHMVIHNGKKVRCPLCSNGYRDNYNLVNHLTKTHKMDQESAKQWLTQAVTS